MGITDQLKAALRAYGTAYRAGKDSGVEITAVARFLNGQRDLRLGSADKLCRVLGLELRPIRKPRAKKGK